MGNGTLMASPRLKIAIGLGVGRGIPFAEGAERIVRPAATAGLGEDHALIIDFVNQFITRLQAQGGANRLWNGGLRLGRQLAGDHDGLYSKFVRNLLIVRIFLWGGNRDRSSGNSSLTGHGGAGDGLGALRIVRKAAPVLAFRIVSALLTNTHLAGLNNPQPTVRQFGLEHT